MGLQDVMLRLLVENPFYGYVGASVTPIESTGVKTIKMILTPSLKLIYNPEWFEGLGREKQAGVVIHELLHLILLHPFRIGNREPNLWAVACDMSVNQHIEKRMIPPSSITIEIIENELRRELPKLKSAEFYYDIITKQDDIVVFTGRDGEVILVFDSDKQLEANRISEEPISDMNKKSLKSDIAQAIEQASEEGEVPAGIENIVDSVYHEFKINWRNVLKRFLSGRGKMQIRKSYKRQSRRFDYLPGTKRSIGVNALLAIDESGSISDDLSAKFYKEVQSLNKITGASLKVVRFDTTCTEPVPINEYVKSKERIKNGGTDFRPIFEKADRHKIPLVIIFTDGDGIAPDSANQTTLWVMTKGGKKPAEFGHYVVFDE